MSLREDQQPVFHCRLGMLDGRYRCRRKERIREARHQEIRALEIQHQMLAAGRAVDLCFTAGEPVKVPLPNAAILERHERFEHVDEFHVTGRVSKVPDGYGVESGQLVRVALPHSRRILRAVNGRDDRGCKVQRGKVPAGSTLTAHLCERGKRGVACATDPALVVQTGPQIRPGFVSLGFRGCGSRQEGGHLLGGPVCVPQRRPLCHASIQAERARASGRAPPPARGGDLPSQPFARRTPGLRHTSANRRGRCEAGHGAPSTSSPAAAVFEANQSRTLGRLTRMR